MLKLTKTSEKELRGYHAGSGRYFISEGDGQEFRSADISLRHTEGRYFIVLGYGYMIELTPDQVTAIGSFFIEDIDHA